MTEPYIQLIYLYNRNLIKPEVSMAIYKAQLQNQFTQIPNETLQNSGLTADSLGVLVHILSLPCDFAINSTYLRKKFPKSINDPTMMGREKMSRILLEIEEVGYMTKKKVRKTSGRYSYDYFVYPIKVPANPQESDDKMLVSPHTGYPSTAHPTPASPTLKNKHIKNIRSSSKPAAAVFDFDLVLAWILTQLKTVHGLSPMDEIFITACLEEYQDGADTPSKSRALSWVEVGLRQRLVTERRSAQASRARDKLTNSVVNQLDAQTTVINQHTNNLTPRSDRLVDRSWDNDLVIK